MEYYFHMNFPSFIEYTQYTLVQYLSPPEVLCFFDPFIKLQDDTFQSEIFRKKFSFVDKISVFS